MDNVREIMGFTVEAFYDTVRGTLLVFVFWIVFFCLFVCFFYLNRGESFMQSSKSTVILDCSEVFTRLKDERHLLGGLKSRWKRLPPSPALLTAV